MSLHPLTPIRSFSYGGGVQSTAALVLAAQGVIDFPLFLFANVGDDSEDPRSLAYVEDVAKPYAAANGIELVTLHKVLRDGTPETLLGRLVKEGSRSLPIPVRMSNGAPGTRSCTADFKIAVIAKELKRRGASKDNVATVGIGISTDEIQRVSNKKVATWERVEYPLIDLGISRDQCQQIIAKAGLPVPGKSSCFFCPFHRPSAWVELQRERPDLFQKSVELERLLNARRDALGKDHVFLTRFARPLDVAIGPDIQQAFDFEYGGFESCDEGVCFV